MLAARWVLGVAIACAGCGSGGGEGPRPVGAAAPLRLAEGSLVAYLLTWSWDGARREGESWVFETDRGYTVGISSAALAIGRVELVPCEPGRGGSLGDAVSSLLVATAHAGHSRVADGSAVSSPAIGSLLEPEAQLYGRGFAGPEPYCGLHMLAVPLAGETEDGAALARESLALTGYWSAPGDSERHELRARINLQDGSTRPLLGWTSWPTALQRGRAPVAVVITRRPARAFDGLELAAMSELDLGFAVLGNLMQGAQVEVASAAGDPG